MLFLVKKLEESQFLSNKYCTKPFKSGEVILNAEEELNSLFVIKAGRLKTYSLSENGLKHLIRIYEAGGLLGDIELFTKRDVICYVEAIDEGEMYLIERNDFLEWLKIDFDISFYIMEQLAQKLYETSIQMQSAVIYPLKYQVLLYIWRYVCQYKSHLIPKIIIVEGLASSTRSINRILKQLDEESIIKNLNGQIEVEDLSKVLGMISEYDREIIKKP